MQAGDENKLLMTEIETSSQVDANCRNYLILIKSKQKGNNLSGR